MNTTRAALACLILAGCVNSGPMRVGKDTYSISTRVTMSGASGARSDALRSAERHCASQKKLVALQSSNARECAWHGGCGEAEITYMCLDENDPRYAATTEPR